jgi:hypothetical protein
LGGSYVAGCIFVIDRFLYYWLYPRDRRFLYCMLYPCDGDIRWGLLPSPKMFINTIIIKLEMNDTLSVNASRNPLTLVLNKIRAGLFVWDP